MESVPCTYSADISAYLATLVKWLWSRPLMSYWERHLARQRLVDRLRIKAAEAFVADQDERQRPYPHAHELLHRLGITRHILFRKFHAFLR
jgi:hypothetical protein